MTNLRISDQDFQRRVNRLQEEMKKENVDLWVGYSSESEASISLYLAGFQPFFDFAGVMVPREGEAVLITGGPESFEMAKEFSRIKKILIHGLFVETSAPEWVPDTEILDFSTIIPQIMGKIQPKKIAISQWNTFPYLIFQDLVKNLPNAEVVSGDEMLLRVRQIKSKEEIEVIAEAYRITEESVKRALEVVQTGVSERFLENEGRKVMLDLGAEGTSYPIWVCSGRNTSRSLCKSTDKLIQANELVQITFGARYQGYCGNMCRVFSIGEPDPKVKKMMLVALQSMEDALETIRPGVLSTEVFKKYHNHLAKYGWEKFTLYGPAHGTGVSEVEGLWLSESNPFVIQPNMVFNIDIWLTDGEVGMRYEDGIVVTEKGIREFNPYRREIIIL
ncbi:MAG: Xaa-Pro peptidase family protein [Atribacterota bacterium]|jgi:Xaa-Pro aminopeptidase|nr:Xaa-Pro peptidase family protein [Atribacterota bacterium]